MSAKNEALVTAMCDAMIEGKIDRVLSYLSEDVFYHNLPYAPIVGVTGVEEFLGPFVEARHGGLERIEYLHTLSDDNTVMNARNETWRHRDKRVVLPVAGVFKVEAKRITRWCDYWDTATLKPLLEAR
jgi:limonene-1,2-epoxide hydrolase